MESSRKLLQVVRAALLLSIAIYVCMVGLLPVGIPGNPIIYQAVSAFVVADFMLIFVFKRTFVTKSEQALALRPDDATALQRWRAGYLVTWCIGEAAALSGLILHFLGFSIKRVSPFFLAGFLVILMFPPRRPIALQ